MQNCGKQAICDITQKARAVVVMLDLQYYAVVIPATYCALLYLHKALFLGARG